MTDDPLNGTILGNAGLFVVWKDIQTATNLFERAFERQPTAGWLRQLVIALYFEVNRVPLLYRNEMREQLIHAGVRSLKTESGGAVFMTCEYVSDAALSLGQLEIVRWCAEILRQLNDTTCEQMANAFIGLVALRENDHDLAIRMLLKQKRGYEPQQVVFRLARELFELGERESIAELIYSFQTKIKKSVRIKWLEQIANDELPDFEEHCC